MYYVDYREKLGIGIRDEQKHLMYLNKIINYIDANIACNGYPYSACCKYMNAIGEQMYNPKIRCLKESLSCSKSFLELIAKSCMFANTFSNDRFTSSDITRSKIIKSLKEIFRELKIPIEIIKDADGYFIFPKGAKELDDALVSEPLEWLKDYPNARKTYVIALKQYSDGVYIRDVADNLRKALEAFLQEFLGNTKNLETNKNEICKYLGEYGVDSGISGLFQPLINSYKNINDRIAKHNDAVDEKLLEFLLYQTGVLIRMVISIKKSEEQ